MPKQRAAFNAASSHIDRNQRDKAHRLAISMDQTAFMRRKAIPYEWLEVLRSLDVLSPGMQLSEKVICNHILGSWWDLRFDSCTRPIYLPHPEVFELSRAIVLGAAERPQRFEDGVFNVLYRSVVPSATDKRVCFFLHRNQSALSGDGADSTFKPNHYFPVLFDYGAHRAYAFGTLNAMEVNVSVKEGQKSDWHRWQGSQLWEIIGYQLGWAGDIGDPATVGVVVKNWKQVGRLCAITQVCNTDLYL